jgi:hypothetical protein
MYEGSLQLWLSCPELGNRVFSALYVSLTVLQPVRDYRESISVYHAFLIFLSFLLCSVWILFICPQHWHYFSSPFYSVMLTLWHRSFTFNSNKSPTWCNSFSVYYPDVCLQLNMFRAFSRPSSGAQWLQRQPLVLPSYCGDSRAVFMVGLVGPTTNTARLLYCPSYTAAGNL